MHLPVGGHMGHLETIEKAAQKLIALCQKEKQTKTDKEKMLIIQAEILAGIENLAECELCGSISEIIVTMTLADVTAKLCKECGVKSLEAGKIQSSKQGTSGKRARRAKTPNSTIYTVEIECQIPPVPSKQNRLRYQKRLLHYIPALKQKQVSRKRDVKRLHKIVQDIATPMNPEHTLTYVQPRSGNSKNKS